MEKLDNKMEKARKSIDENRANQGAIFIKDPKKRRKCPLCKQNLYLYYISFEQMFLMCENDFCDFPFGYEVLQIVREESELRENPDRATKDFFEYPTTEESESLTIGSMLSCTTSCASDCDGLSTISTIGDPDDLSLVKPEMFSTKLSRRSKERQKQKQKDDELELDLTHTKQLTETINQLDKDVDFMKNITGNKSWMKNLKVWEVVTGQKLIDKTELSQKDVEYSLSQPSGSGASPIINIQIFNEKTPRALLFVEPLVEKEHQETPDNDRIEDENQKIPYRDSKKEVFLKNTNNYENKDLMHKISDMVSDEKGDESQKQPHNFKNEELIQKILSNDDNTGEFLRASDDKKEAQRHKSLHNNDIEEENKNIPDNDRKKEIQNDKNEEDFPNTPNIGKNKDLIHKIPDNDEKKGPSPKLSHNDGNKEEIQKKPDDDYKDDEFINSPDKDKNRDQIHKKPGNDEQDVQSLKQPHNKEEESEKTPSNDEKEKDIQKKTSYNDEKKETIQNTPDDDKEVLCRNPPHNDEKERGIQKPPDNNGVEEGILQTPDDYENRDLIPKISDYKYYNEEVQSQKSNDRKQNVIPNAPDNAKNQEMIQNKAGYDENREKIHTTLDKSEKENQKMPHDDEKDHQSQKTPPNYRKKYQTRKSPRNLGTDIQKLLVKNEEDKVFLKTPDNDEKAMQDQIATVEKDIQRPKTPRTYGKKYQTRKSPRKHGNKNEVKK